ncbi:MAG: hypothetical protein H8E79_06210 [Desulfobulbaceae bacterium]|uniref:Uncharacterized protein n=1 Tax=Candidatus Desulfatifera sulfidica TaxID=2841691 RepID=A0A8J6N8D5_9BACT|nr:hypothetical protein [Candidatus Desulfatifera sulfidica]
MSELIKIVVVDVVGQVMFADSRLEHGGADMAGGVKVAGGRGTGTTR